MTWKSYVPKKYRAAVSLAILIISAIIYLINIYGGNDLTKQASTNQPGLYQVTEFVDGDTIAINMNGHSEKVRFIGVDTPETHKPNTPVQCYGPEASAFTKKAIGISKVRLVSDSQTTDRDRYNRLLRYVYLTDGTNLNSKIIAEGYGFYYPYFPFTKYDEFSKSQAKAIAAKKGLWSVCKPTQTDRGGWLSNSQN